MDCIGGQQIVDMLVDHHERGMSLRGLEKKYGVCFMTISGRLKRHGLLPRGWG